MNVSVYSAELLVEKLSPLEAGAFLPALRKWCSRVELAGGEEASNALLFSFPDHESQYEDGNKMLAQVALIHRPAPIETEQLLPFIHQSWLWPDCQVVLAKHKSVLFITDLFADLLDRRQRLALFKNAVRAVLEVVPALALKWTPSQQLLPPALFLERSNGHEDPLFPAVNVRMFKAAAEGSPEIVMDTMGLEIFGLPDFQCRHQELEPRQVAAALYEAASYVFDRGDVVKDGETMQLAELGWTCREAEALAAPSRRVRTIERLPH